MAQGSGCLVVMLCNWVLQSVAKVEHGHSTDQQMPLEHDLPTEVVLAADTVMRLQQTHCDTPGVILHTATVPN